VLEDTNDLMEILGSLIRPAMAWTTFCADPEPSVSES
jgi:hypothetical protein